MPEWLEKLRRRVDTALTPDDPEPEVASGPERDPVNQEIEYEENYEPSDPWRQIEHLRRQRATIKKHVGGGLGSEVKNARRRRSVLSRL